MSRATICIKFCVKLEHSSAETIGWFRRLQLWAAGDWQLHHDHVPAHASRLMQSFLAKHQITQVTRPPYSPGLVPYNFWLFPKLKSALKGKRFQTINEIWENMTGQLMAIGRTLWDSSMPTLKGIEASLSYVQCFLSLVSSSINVSIFHCTWLDTFWADLIDLSKLKKIFLMCLRPVSMTAAFIMAIS